MSYLQITAFALNALGLCLSFYLWKRQRKFTKIIREQINVIEELRELTDYKTRLIQGMNKERKELDQLNRTLKNQINKLGYE